MRKYLFALFTILCFGASFAQEDYPSTEDESQNSEESSTEQQKNIPIYYVQQTQQQNVPVYYQAQDANGQVIYYQTQPSQPIYQANPNQPQPIQKTQKVYYANSNQMVGQSANAYQPAGALTPQEQRIIAKQNARNQRILKANDPYHSGFYIEGAIGGHYSSFSSKEMDGNVEKTSMSGLGTAASFKFGGNIRGYVALYSNLNITLLSGDVKETSYGTYYDKEYTKDGNAINILEAVGVAVTPIPDPEKLFNNVFLGYSIGLSLNNGDISYTSYTMQFELGKLWKIASRFNIGLSAVYNMYISLEDEEDVQEYKEYSIGIMLKFIRK